jgi:hypothetical protein
MPMMQGYVAMLDVLGFKGIWARQGVSPDLLLDRMQSLEKALKGEARWRNENEVQVRPYRTSVALLSDTVVIGAGFEGVKDLHDVKESQRRNAFLTIGSIARRAVREWAMGDPPMAVRGCVAAGSYMIKKSFLVGKAVDEAAEYHEMCEGALVWASPTVVEALSNDSVEYCLKKGAWVRWDVPLKPGVLPTLTLNLARTPSNQGLHDRVKIVDGILNAFEASSSLSVIMKKHNTRKFLESCETTFFEENEWKGADLKKAKQAYRHLFQ